MALVAVATVPAGAVAAAVAGEFMIVMIVMVMTFPPMEETRMHLLLLSRRG
jgi:hypothetical protein